MSQKNETVQDYLQKAGNVSKEYLNIFKTKLTNTVVDTVYMAENITKTVLPGNPVTRDYEVNRHIGSAGPGLLWKLYAGFKKSTKQEATVFVLNKKQLETYSKRNRDLIIEAFKKGATQLARIKHPRILSLQHQLEESKDSLAFATEPCFCSLANALGNQENMPVPLPPEFADFKLLEVEIKYGLMQVSEGLSFLHKDVKLLHRNICPESIIINVNGAWKIAGFELFVTNCNDPNDPLKFPFKEWDGSVDATLNPRLEYLAPEYGLASTCECSADMYSYGMLFHAVYNGGKTLYTCDASYTAFVHHVEDLRKNSNLQVSAVPSEMKEYLKMLLHINPELRPDASQVMKIPFFDDVAVKTLEYLDASFQVDNLQKSHFFKSLPSIINKLPQRVNLQRIIPCLEQEFINPDMIPFLLPNIFLIAEQSTNDEYVRHILPRLKTIFKVQKPIQVVLCVVRNMALILSKTPPTDIKEHILPMVCRSLESESVEVQDLCLTSLPTFANLLDTQAIKMQLLPRIRKLCLESPTLSIRISSLVCIGKLLEFLEKWIVLDDVLPILERVNVRDSAVLMAMLGIYKVVLTHPKLGITKEILANRVIPFLVPLSIDASLNLSQFNAYLALIREMLVQIEGEQRKKLEQIEAMEREKSIIPYAFANAAGTNRPESAVKAPETSMMGQLMIGYGVANVNSNPPPSYGKDIMLPAASATSPAAMRKKELTLDEKHELAARLEKEHISVNNNNNNNNNYNNNFGSSNSNNKPANLMSMNNSTAASSNYSYLTDLDDLTSSSSSNGIGTMKAIMPPVAATTPTATPTVGFNLQLNSSGSSHSISSAAFAQSRPNTMMGMGMGMSGAGGAMMNQQQQQQAQHQGFFGNLALPAPPSPNGGGGLRTSSSMTLNAMSSSSTNNNKPMSVNFNTANATPSAMSPMMSPLKPHQPAANQSTMFNAAAKSGAPGKKSAMDDLADIFG